ncbi:MAG: polysaccharide biosynthesis C-terminal domain-containing protein [Saprospiraceae bacterium]
MSALKTLAKETIVYGLSYSLGRVINFLLVTFYLTHYVFTKQDGSISLYQDLYFYIAIFLGILTLRMETTLFRFINKAEFKDTIYALLTQLVFIACIAFIFFYLIFKNQILRFLQYPEDFAACVFLACLILIFDVLVSLPFAKLRYDKRPLKYAWIKLSSILLNIVFVLYIFEIHFNDSTILGLSSSSKIFYILLANVVSSFVTLLLLYKEIQDSFRKADWSKLKQILEYSWPLIVITLIYTVIQNGYTSFLKFILPGTRLENLTASDDLVAAVRLAVIMNIFITAFNYAAEPFFFRQAESKDSRINYANLNLFFVFACCIIYLLTCLNVSLISLLIGPEYQDAMYLLPVFLLANIFAGLYSNISAWYKLTDRTKDAAWISLIGLIVNCILFFLLIPIFGKEATAYISLIVYFVMTLISYLQGQKYYPIPYNLIKTSAYLCATIAVVYVVNYLMVILQFNALINAFISLLLAALLVYIIYHFEWKKLTENQK